MHLGAELVETIKTHGGHLLSEHGHHQVWRFQGKIFRIAVAGRRPNHVMHSLAAQIKRLVEEQKRNERTRKPREPKEPKTPVQETSSPTPLPPVDGRGHEPKHAVQSVPETPPPLASEPQSPNGPSGKTRKPRDYFPLVTNDDEGLFESIPDIITMESLAAAAWRLHQIYEWYSKPR